MMLSMGAMTAVNADLYEAAKIDGASSAQVLAHVTLPLVLYQTMPQIVMSFMHNLNNFGIIFFLTGGMPLLSDSTTTLAGATDILVSHTSPSLYDLVFLNIIIAKGAITIKINTAITEA